VEVRGKPVHSDSPLRVRAGGRLERKSCGSKRKGRAVHQLLRRRARAEAYSTLEFKNTYHLAYRDIPSILAAHVRGRKAVDFGCGTDAQLASCSTRLRGHWSRHCEDMVHKARVLDPSGLPPGSRDDLRVLPRATFDLVLAAFTFDNIAGRENKARILRDLGCLLTREGNLVLIVSRRRFTLTSGLVFDQGLS